MKNNKIKRSIIQLFGYSIIGGLGWIVGGPPGGVLAFVAAAIIDSLFIKKDNKKLTGVFSTGLLMLIAAVLNAKTPVTDTKLGVVKQFLKKNYGEKFYGEAFIKLKEIMKQNIPLNDACIIICNNLDNSSRLQLMQFLYALAKIDGKITNAEQSILNIIANGMRLTFGSKPVFSQNDAIIIDAYNLLGVNAATNATDIKKAYRKLAFEWHPDKVAHLGEEHKKAANEKFLHLTKAYEIIKKNRKQ